MIPPELVDRVRESADIVQIIGSHVTLKRSGADYRGPCPFHGGKNPNFSVSPKRGMYHCFKCQESGNVFNFLQKHLGLSFPDAVRSVAETVGIVIPDNTPERAGPDPREWLWEINAAASEFFTEQLWSSPAAQQARDYLDERGFARDIIEPYRLGYAPREIGVFRAHMETLGYEADKLLESGLMSKSDENSEARPRFRNRLMFPILDATGNTVAFGGRALGDIQPKYLNSPETQAFAKRRTLYALNWTKNDIRKEDRAFVVEGYFDAIRLMISGLNVAVAPLGTALTDAQAQLISRYTKNVYLIYDSDQAGLKATFRAGDELLRHGMAVRVITLPDGEDPDTIVRKRGAAALEEYVSQSVDIFERKLQLLERGGWFSELQKKRKALDRILPTVRATSDPLLKEIYISRAAEKTGIAKDVLLREVGVAEAVLEEIPVFAEEYDHQFMMPQDAPPARTVRKRGKKQGVAAEKAIVMALLAEPSRLPSIESQITADHFRDEDYRTIFETIVELGEGFTVESLADQLDPEVIQVLNDLLSEVESIADISGTINSSVSQMFSRNLRDRLSEIDTFISLATEEEKDALLQEKVRLRKEVATLGEPMTKHDKLWKGKL